MWATHTAGGFSLPILANLAYQPIAYDVPGEDQAQAKAINTGPLSWTAAGAYTLDPTQSNQLLEVQNIQSIFVDNYNTGTLIITVGGSGQVLRVPPKSQAFLPLIAGDRPVLTFANAGANGSSQAWLMNVPALGVVWQLP